MDKTTLIQFLPFQLSDYTIRMRTREDIDLRCSWPSYPSPYGIFNSSLIGKNKKELEIRFNKENPNKLTLSVEHKEEKLVGSLTLHNIDWNKLEINNMGIRIHPDWCDKSIGSMLLSGITEWCFGNGFSVIRFDVSKENMRAIRAYRKAGYRIKSEEEVGMNLHWLMEKRIDNSSMSADETDHIQYPQHPL